MKFSAGAESPLCGMTHGHPQKLTNHHTPLYISRRFLQYFPGLPTSLGKPCPKV